MINDQYYKKVSFSIIIIAAIILQLIVTMKPLAVSGEMDSYMMPIISLEQRMSFFINQSDIDKARLDFPNLYSGVMGYNDLRSSKLIVIESNKWLGWYFPTYSIAALPVKLILKTLRLNQSYTLLLTNVLFYVIALIVVLKKLKITESKRLLLIILLICNPIFFYTIVWGSAESFIFSLVVMSLVFFSNKQYKTAGLLVSIAGSLNPTIMIYGAVIIVSYFVELFKKNNVKQMYEVIQILKNKFLEILKLGLCFVPSIVPFIFYYFAVGKLSVTAFAGTTNFLFERFYTYLFDLNLGIFPYFPVALILFFIIIFRGLFLRNTTAMLYLVAFFGTIFTYSMMLHINSGMTGIARYNSWVTPIMLFYIVTEGLEIVKKKLYKRVYFCSLYISSFISAIIIMFYLYVPTSYVYHTPIATAILNNFPQLYNPLYSTFISRTTHVDGGYSYTKPVIYADEGRIRKILVTNDTIKDLQKEISGSSGCMQMLNNKIEAVKGKSGYQYINIPRSSQCSIEIGIEKKELFAQELIDVTPGDKNVYAFGIPTEIKPNTVYKVEFTAKPHSTISNFYVDFYGNNGAYDFNEQQQSVNLINKEKTYTILINSGNYQNIYNAYVRFVYSGERPFQLKDIHITEMENMD